MGFNSPTGIENLTGLFQHANYLTGYNFGWMILGTWFLISTVVMNNKVGIKGAVVISAVQVTVMGILFRVLNLVNDFTMYFILIGTIIVIGVSMKD